MNKILNYIIKKWILVMQLKDNQLRLKEFFLNQYKKIPNKH